jgi:hypothetical protein
LSIARGLGWQKRMWSGQRRARVSIGFAKLESLLTNSLSMYCIYKVCFDWIMNPELIET